MSALCVPGESFVVGDPDRVTVEREHLRVGPCADTPP